MAVPCVAARDVDVAVAAAGVRGVAASVLKGRFVVSGFSRTGDVVSSFGWTRTCSYEYTGSVNPQAFTA